MSIGLHSSQEVMAFLEKKHPKHNFAWKKAGKGYVGFCPVHEDRRTPNLFVLQNEDNEGWHWYCFSCGYTGPKRSDLDPIEGDVYILKNELARQVREKRELGYDYLAERVDYLFEKQTQDMLFNIFEIGYHFFEPKFTIDFSRKFKDIVSEIPILWERNNHEWLVFPYRNLYDGALCELKFRNIWIKKDDQKWKDVGIRIARIEDHNKKDKEEKKKDMIPIFGYKNIFSQAPVLFIVEGEFDAITTTIATNGLYPAITLGGTSRFTRETIEQIAKKAKGKIIVVQPDWDRAGQETLYRLVEQLDTKFLQKYKLYTIRKPPSQSENVKDLDEYLQDKYDYIDDAMADLMENLVPLYKLKQEKEKQEKEKLAELYPIEIQEVLGIETKEQKNTFITDTDILSKIYKKEEPIFDIFYRGINILAGDTGVGKSYSLLRIAIEYTQKTKQKALLIFYEDEEGEFFQKRLNFAIEDYCAKNRKDRKDYIAGLLDICFYYPPIFSKEYGEIKKNKHFQEFKKDIETHGLICIDPLLSFVGITELDSSLLRNALVEIKNLMSENQKYLIFSHHVTKDVENVTKISQKQILHKEDLVKLRIVIRGSGEIVNVARNVIFALPTPSNEGKNIVRLVTVKSNVAPINVVRKITLPWSGYENLENSTVNKASTSNTNLTGRVKQFKTNAYVK